MTNYKVYGIRNLNGKWLTPSGWGKKKKAIPFNELTVYTMLDSLRSSGEKVTYELLYTDSELKDMAERERIVKQVVKQEINVFKRITRGIK